MPTHPIALMLVAVILTGDEPPSTQPAPLDPRVDPARITEIDPPPLPEQVVLPLPPDHHVATDPARVPVARASFEAARTAIGRGAGALRRLQSAEGGWLVDSRVTPSSTDPLAPAPPSPVAVAVTALAVKTLVQADPAAASSEDVRRALAFIDRARRADGAFEGGSMTNYVTSSVVSALSGLDELAFRDRVDDGVRWLQESQWDEGEGLRPEQDWYGGAGYGNRGRPDLSNTQMMLEAMYDAGLSPDEPAFQRALAFVSRAQNLRSTNAASWAGTDGGFVYTPAGGGESFASEHAGEGRYGESPPAGVGRSLRSYGSMTYAGFKSLLYAGLSPDDVRVRAAFDWIRRHWTFDENPGLGRQGLYYYYHAMARALRVGQQTVITDNDGTPHNWREELITAVTKRQGESGLWRNDADRWLEGEEAMATIFALLALEEAIKPAR
ncbi:MAG: hypothetical protein HKO59_11490 [Phycisphaerales bacterium]|nr:hypothetical protein [Phycisphaerae bacterium]NNM26586.1 hypothetical protein [Phycisphaerales bacterium]